ncbi:IQ calmodulin-binding motif protein [Aspergillus alliaceus]|uniref:IQ calmodulin-binding motif protein n=1 Tax=Petromyces alliaceus TaxID=209559 RepID=UPI0012A5E87F|nr:uncharacterized protein BDW43DRAFT_318405 [Aspergillus alliaceus]KAB8235569.1 hypothetical protein BDW43DRAFT_318405 [Aspergillus alliaceus]
MIPERVYQLCHSSKTVSSALAQDPNQAPTKVFHKLYNDHHDEEGKPEPENGVNSHDRLQKALECGNWGPTKPTKLFLQVYHDALCTLEKNPMAGVVSPPFMGGHGILPLTIVAPLPDLCRHMANCIARAETEVFLGTNFWIHSDASTLVTNAFRELSKRAGERGTKVVVKMIYDRGDPRQAYDNRLDVPEKKYTSDKVQLPPADEVPNIDLQVVNYHRPLFGTFHAKFMVIDRRIALLQSSNVQDNDNLEMMVRLEGPIVDAFYDTALISWGKHFNTPFPMLSSPAAGAPPPSLSMMDVSHGQEAQGLSLPEHTTTDQHYDSDIKDEAQRVNGTLKPRPGEPKTSPVTRHLNTTTQPNTTGDAPNSDQDIPMTPYTISPPHETFPMALVNREPWGAPNHSSIYTPQNAAFLSAIQNAEHSIFIQTPNMNAEPLLEPLLEAVRRGVVVTCYLCLGYNDAGQLLPFQNGTNEMISNRLYSSLETQEERSRLRIYNYVAKDQTKPIHNKFKRRSCHIKLMIIDGKVAIQGNGNLDTQSFYHSQEINILIDSPLICRSWLETINRNQNTVLYGAVSPKDGCWHDTVTGEVPEGSIGVNPGRFSWAKGMSHPYDPPIKAITDYLYHYNITDSSAYTAARTALLDTLSCAIETASKSPEARNLLGPCVPGTVVPNGFKLPATRYQLDPVKGAFDLGVLIRYLDHNDALGGAEWGHPSDNLAAILSTTDWLCRSSNPTPNNHPGPSPPLTIRTLLEALIKAYEIQGCYQMRNAFNALGTDHVILVKLASAAVVSWLLGLTEAQTMATISHVWMDGHPSRIYRTEENTISRKGWAAGDAGMRAVHLALVVRAGQDGVPGVLGSVPWGFYRRCFGGEAFEFPRAFGTWTVRNVVVKVMPVEGHGIAAVEGMLVQRERLVSMGLGAGDVERIEVRTTGAADLIINKRGPLYNAADRDHCIQYVVALALLKGEAPEARDYLDESCWARSEELAAMRERIIVVADDRLTADYLDLEKKSIGSALTVYFRDGTILPEVLVEYPIGHVKNPRSAAAVRDKIMRNMRLIFSEAHIARILAAVENDDMNISEFVDMFWLQTSTESRL